MVYHGLNLIMVLIAIGGSITKVNAHCKRTCHQMTLPYPFGFSDGCPIRFNCSRSGLAMIGNYSVQTVTGDSMLMSIPFDCNRTIEDMKPLFGDLYAPSLENSFLVEKCTRPTDGCSIKRKFLETQLNKSSCDVKGKIGCISLNTSNTSKFFSMENLRQSSCRLLFSSIVVESNGGDAGIALEFEQVRLGWWLKGDCRNVTCSKNSVCSHVGIPGGNSGYRCTCPEGYDGDGFIHPCREGLCRQPTNRNCSDVEDEDIVFDMVGFYWTLTVTFVTVFSGFLVLLCFESPPRQAWFSLVDNFIHLARRKLGSGRSNGILV